MDSKLVIVMLALACIIAIVDVVKANEPETYFGVDASDAEAVAQKQKELGDETVKRIFGDIDPDEHFNFDLPSEKTVVEKLTEVGDKLKDVINKFADLFPTSTDKQNQ